MLKGNADSETNQNADSQFSRATRPLSGRKPARAAVELVADESNGCPEGWQNRLDSEESRDDNRGGGGIRRFLLLLHMYVERYIATISSWHLDDEGRRGRRLTAGARRRARGISKP